jgi:hypothetical protein
MRSEEERKCRSVAEQTGRLVDLARTEIGWLKWEMRGWRSIEEVQTRLGKSN